MDECILALSRLLMSCVDKLVHTDFYVSSGGWVGLPLFFMNALKIFARPPNPFLFFFRPLLAGRAQCRSTQLTLWVSFGKRCALNIELFYLCELIPQTVYCWGSQCCLKCVRLGWGAVSASQSLSPVFQFVSHLALSFTLGGVQCPPRWACLPICLPSGFVSQFSLPICFPSGFVFHLAWGAVSASLGLSPVLSPNLSPTWLCLSPWLGCCVRLAGLVCGLVSQFVSHLALSPTQFCLRICSPSGFAFHLGWGAVSASLGLSGLVSHPTCLPICLPSGSVPIWLCLSPWLGCCVHLVGLVNLSPKGSPIWLCLSPWLGCCVRLAGLVSQFVSHLALSFTLAGVLCPPRWACLPICLRICPPSGFVFHLLGLSAVLSPNLSPIWLCLPVFSPHLFRFVFHLGWGAVCYYLPTYLPTLPYPTLPYPTLPYPISVPY